MRPILILFLCLIPCYLTHECIVKSPLQDIDLSNPNVYIQSEDFTCPQPLVNYTITLQSPSLVTLHHPPSIAFLVISSEVPVTIVDSFSAFEFHFNSNQHLTIESFIGHVRCQQCSLDIITAILISPIFGEIKISGYATILSPDKIHFTHIINSGTLSIISPYPPQIDSYKGYDYTTFLTPSSIYNPSSGVVPSRSIVSILHPYQNVIISEVINNVFISSSRATINNPLSFHSIFLLNGELKITEPIVITMLSASHSKIILDGGMVKSFMMTLNHTTIEVNHPVETFFITHSTIVDSLNVKTYYRSTANSFKVIESNTEIKLINSSSLQLIANNKVVVKIDGIPIITGFKQCHIISNGQKELFIGSTKVKYREEYCPCNDCELIVEESQPVILYFDDAMVGGINCITECIIKSKKSMTFNSFKGKKITVTSNIIINMLIPVDGGEIIFEKNVILLNSLNNRETTSIIGNDNFYFKGTTLVGIKIKINRLIFFSNSSGVIIEKGSNIDLGYNAYIVTSTTTTLLGSIQCRAGTIACIRIGPEGSFVFEPESKLGLVVNVSEWKGDPQYLLFSPKKLFNQETKLPQLYLIDNTTNQIKKTGRLYVECFGKWIMYKLSSDSYINCNPFIQGHVELPSSSPFILKFLFFIIFAVVIGGVIFFIFGKKKNKFRNDRIELDSNNSPPLIIVESDE
ncbi:hypothetical protein EDI_057410 [Entamoeba dispar SAW760]|uniref:Transmembrane protein n=1 Tax=Entamoeba dispar (strain ATCC PRA-260 / SAW760) TaxID=370354 RepID=B0E9U4_ENTDS|nr:uncharacterized protein EDI_057410 [Entamoeba dispar SAW760]EDR28705.1 hypothetical protein EDI_057410 [Entamoeba dispar SAW760]|eukprot:EDR28705.1 hypothetical protein EDI_057410 [Entamoeba dispar SAW760]